MSVSRGDDTEVSRAVKHRAREAKDGKQRWTIAAVQSRYMWSHHHIVSKAIAQGSAQ